jgi:N6-adenosine-specific RNA methylase IME4
MFLSDASKATKSGTGNYIPANAEVCLLGGRGSKLARNVDPERGKEIVERQIIFTVPGKHSAKPNEAQRRIWRMYGRPDRNAFEAFARRPVDPELEKEIGPWSTFGNELPTT